MIVTPTINSAPRYSKRFRRQYKTVAKHTLHLSKHAVRIVTVTSIVGGLSFVVINLALLTMQITSLPLFLKIGNINLSLQTPGQARVALSSYGQAQKLKLNVQGKEYQVPADQAGIKLNIDGIMSSVQHPKGWDKVPLFYAIGNYHGNFPLQYSVNNKKLNAYLSSVSLPQAQAPANASVLIPSDVKQAAYITPEKAGYEYKMAMIADQVNKAVVSNKNLTITIQAQVLQPKVTTKQLSGALTQTNELLSRQLTITNGQASYKLTAGDLRQVVVLDNSAGTPAPVISHKQIVELLRAHSNLFYKAPTSTKVSTLDGNVVTKTNGTNGQTINIEATANQLVKALRAGQSRQSVTLAAVSPSTVYLRNYTATSAGLAALIRDFAATHPGKYSVATFELNDSRSAYYNQNAATVPASTYKLFVAYVALKKIEQGSLSFSSQTSAGSLDACMHKMILVSDNTCAKAIIALIGWNETESQVKAAGFGSTNINNSGGGYMSSTANDVAKLLKGFYNGTLLNTSDTNYLFDLMKHQVYRSGIPAGSPGAVVADKVGFLEAWNHDAAIVYAPNSTYVLVIFTTNSSFSQIKALSNQIFNLYNQ